MARAVQRRSKKSMLRKLRSTLTQMTELPPQPSVQDGDTYVCAYCDLPVKVCEQRPNASCKSKLREGTILQVLSDVDRDVNGLCLSCNEPIPRTILKKKPLTEICPLCERRVVRIRTTKRSKGILP